MSRWSVRNPEAMDEIASLPPSQQNEAIRAAVGPVVTTEERRDRIAHGACRFCARHEITRPFGHCEYCWDRYLDARDEG